MCLSACGVNLFVVLQWCPLVTTSRRLVRLHPAPRGSGRLVSAPAATAPRWAGKGLGCMHWCCCFKQFRSSDACMHCTNKGFKLAFAVCDCRSSQVVVVVVPSCTWATRSACSSGRFPLVQRVLKMIDCRSTLTGLVSTCLTCCQQVATSHVTHEARASAQAIGPCRIPTTQRLVCLMPPVLTALLCCCAVCVSDLSCCLCRCD